jgi:PAS domain S-box-containing protein
VPAHPPTTPPSVGRADVSRVLLDGLRDHAILALDPAGHILSWSAGAESMTGWAAAEVLGRAASVLDTADGLSGGGGIERALARADVEGRAEHESWWVRRDGRRVWVNVVVSRLHEPGGGAVGAGEGGPHFALIARDITERRRTGEALSARSALVRLLQGVAVAANEAETVEDALAAALTQLRAYTGWPVGHAYLRDDATGELASTGLWQLAASESLDEFRAVSARMRFAPGVGILGGVLATGQPVWLEDASAHPEFLRAGAAGVRAGFALPVLVGREVVAVLECYSAEPAPPNEALLATLPHVGMQLGRVVERVRAREALRRSEARFAGIISLSPDAIISVDDAQRITLFNRAAEETFGYTAAEALGQPLDLLLPAHFAARHREMHVPAFTRAPEHARRMGERTEVFGRRKSGEEFPADVSISKMFVDGRPSYNAVLRDVTERRRAEAALRARSEELARSNAELEQFAYVASHDLQEPLRMVASYTQLLQRRYQGQLDAQADRYIRFAVDGAQRMQELILDLLALSRVGTQGKPFAPVDVNAVLRRVRHTLRGAAEDAGGAVTAEALPVVRGDPGQLELLLQNLIANALKFRRPGVAPSVHVSAERQGGEHHIAVRDNGIGLEPRFAEQIFVIFQRLHTRAEYAGTGIGLAICKKIVERHGGRIWVESTPGEGSTFHFTLPDTGA